MHRKSPISDRITAYSLSLRHFGVFDIMEPFIMDTRALSMARGLRSSAKVGALVLLAVCSPAFAQQQGDGFVSVPFSSLSAAAQEEVLSLEGGLSRAAPGNAPLFPLETPVARNDAAPTQLLPLLRDGRRVRINWAIGMYR
jgi:hypothetical protein